MAEASLVSMNDPHSEEPRLWGPYGHTHTYDSLLIAQQFRAKEVTMISLTDSTEFTFILHCWFS